MTQKLFDRFKDSYVAVHDKNLPLGMASDEFVEQKTDFLAERIPFWGWSKGVRILDFGCGHGRVLRSLCRKVKVRAYLGIDESTEVLEEADRDLSEMKSGRPDLSRFLPSVEAIPFSERSVDLVLLFNVLHHVLPKERLDLVARLTQHLTPEGRVVVFEHNPLNPLTQWIVRTCPFDENASLLRSGETLDLFHSVGLNLEERSFINYFPPRWSRRLGLVRKFENHLAAWPLGAQYRSVFSRSSRG